MSGIASQTTNAHAPRTAGGEEDGIVPLDRNEIREDILARPCERCGEAVEESDYASDNEPVLTFYRGSFILLHGECARLFIDTAEKGPRPPATDTPEGGAES